MRLLKILAVGALLVLNTACSKDKDSCTPVGEITITMEQLFEKNQNEVFVNLGTGSSYRVGRVGGLRYDTQETFYEPLDSDYEKLLDQFPNFKIDYNNGKRQVVAISDPDDPSTLTPVASKTIQSYLSSSMRTAFVISGSESDLAELKSQFDQLVRTEAKRAVCSSEMQFLLIEDKDSGVKKSMALRYEAKVK